jgi:hypothetical protein
MRSTDTQKETIIVRVMICSYFEEEYVERIREVDELIRVLYREDLVPPPRWPGDHVGPPEWRRSSGDEEEFLAMLGRQRSSTTSHVATWRSWFGSPRDCTGCRQA